MHAELKANAAIIRVVGIFEEKYSKKLEQRLQRIGYKKEVLQDATKGFLKNTFYPEFRDLMFLGEEESSAQVFQLQHVPSITFLKKAGANIIEISTNIQQVEVFLFENGLHFFALELDPKELELSKLSDLMFCARSFETKMKNQDLEITWVDWIEKNYLDNIQISSKSDKKIHVDEFSGSKFKLFTVIDLPENENNIDIVTRENLLYDLGSVAQIGTAGGQSYFSPSDAYFNTLMDDKIAVFNNYTILPLFDTFTALGNSLITSNNESSIPYLKSTWTQTYFRIYLFNIFMKYNLFRYNLEMGDDSVKV
ncbi:MAG: hypothetical protein ACK5AR_04265, partial [Flavobacteriia bacterium]